MRLIALSCAFAAGVVALGATASAQLTDLQPGRNFVAQPSFGAGKAEEADVGDVDLDGDLDVAVAQGKLVGAQLSRLYVNDGTGVFSDETATRFAGFPAMHARDVEFFDAENDGDLDVFFANDLDGGLSPGAVSRFFVNLGGAQSGTAGFFQEATNDFWGALASVPAGQQVFGGDSGPFRDFSCDCDFNDLDDDGDLDLFFSSYGPAFNGTRDSRVFLNDGLATFDEQWPWADAGADTAWISFDFDMADCDGDFDLDLVASGWGQARVFTNNLYTPLGPNAFHEITQSALLDTGAGLTGQVNYEVEFGDADGDTDFDLWVVNHSGNADRLLRNNGPQAGGFTFTRMNNWIKNEPSTDEEDGDFGDYDNDGDLDVFIASFSGTNWLYQSSLAQGLDPDIQGLFHRSGAVSGQSPQAELPSGFNGGQSLDGEWFDADGDADLDLLLTNDFNQGNWLFRNALGVPDTHAPEFSAVTVQGDKPNGSATVIHGTVGDNVPMHLHRYHEASLVYSVDGGAPQTLPMFHQGGQQYRAVIPAQSDALVAYHLEVADLAGNTGVSNETSFVQGVVVSAPWTNLGFGLAGLSGEPSLTGTGPLTPGSAGTLALGNAAPSAVCALFVSLVGTPTAFQCGTLVPVPVLLNLPLITNGSGSIPLAWASWPAGLSGASLHFQYALADGTAVCGVALSNALRADVP